MRNEIKAASTGIEDSKAYLEGVLGKVEGFKDTAEDNELEKRAWELGQEIESIEEAIDLLEQALNSLQEIE